MNDGSLSCAEESHLSSVQRLLHAFSESPASTVLLTTALGEMLGVLSRQQRAIDELTAALQAAREERAREIAAVSRNFAEILHDTVRRTAAAVAELRDSNGSSGSSGELADVRRELAELRRALLREAPAGDAAIAQLREDVAAVRREHDALLELLDVRKTLRRGGYGGDLAADVPLLGTTLAKVQLLHQLPCLHVLAAAAVRSPERGPLRED